MAVRKVLVGVYSWMTDDGAGTQRLWTARRGDHVDFTAGEITRGEALGALGAADVGAITVPGEGGPPIIASVAQSDINAAVAAAVANLVASAPAALNTLDELAAALADDPNFAATMVTSLAGKATVAALAATDATVAGLPTFTDLAVYALILGG